MAELEAGTRVTLTIGKTCWDGTVVGWAGDYGRYIIALDKPLAAYEYSLTGEAANYAMDISHVSVHPNHVKRAGITIDDAIRESGCLPPEG